MATAAVLGVGAAAAAPHAAPAAVRSWLAYHGSVFSSLSADLKTVAAAGDNGSVGSITAGCDQLAADTATIEGLPPIPVARIQGRWRAGARRLRACGPRLRRGADPR